MQTHLHGSLDEDRFPTLDVQLASRQAAFDVTRRLKTGTPAVYVNEGGLHEGVLVLHAMSLDDRTTDTLIERLRQALTD